MDLYFFADQLAIKSKNNRKNCMHGIINSKDNEVVEGRQGVGKKTVQTLNVEVSVKQWFLLKKETVTFLNIDEIQLNWVQLSYIPELFQK